MPTPPRRTPVLLGTQLLFNVGFYAVVPFLALVLSEDFGLGAAAVGLVLGVRTFSQQGMFLVGGGLADRFGARPIILAGCAVRIAGFATLGASVATAQPLLALFVAGTVLTGLGGALFSPGLNVLVAQAEKVRPATGAPGRATLFAWLSVTGELGAVIGPLVGAALWGWGFVVVAFCGAGFFVVIGAVLMVALPDTRVGLRRERGTGRWWSVRDRRFVRFATLHAGDLLAYNQLYLALPLQLARTADAPSVTALMFALVSALTVALQVPVARWTARVGASTAIRAGYALSGSGFLVVAATTPLVLDDAARVATVFAAASLVIVGHLVTNPTALAAVPAFARAHPTGSYFGLLATCGGVAVLGGNLAVGALLGWEAFPAAAWMLLALPLVLAAVAAPRLLAAAAPEQASTPAGARAAGARAVGARAGGRSDARTSR